MPDQVRHDDEANFGVNAAGAVFALAFLSGCNQAPEWKGWVYPNGSDLTRHITIGAFDTLEQCRTSAKTLLANFHLNDGEELIAGDYECGFKCTSGDDLGGVNVCEKTER